MTTPSKPESPQVFLVMCHVEYDGSAVEGVFFDRGRALNLRAELEAKNKFDFVAYRVEAWCEGDTEGTEIKPD